MWVRSLGVEDSLEKEMATHSSILPWKTPWTEEPGMTKHSPGIMQASTYVTAGAHHGHTGQPAHTVCNTEDHGHWLSRPHCTNTGHRWARNA